MKREELLRDPEWWLATIQNQLYSVIYEYMAKNDMNRTDIAQKLGVTKGYVSQVLKGDFDHKLSKFVDIALAFNKVPVVHFVDLDRFVHDDGQNRRYELYAIPNPSIVSFERRQTIAPEPGPRAKITFTALSPT